MYSNYRQWGFLPHIEIFFRVSLISLCLKAFRGVARSKPILDVCQITAKSKQRTAEYSGPSNWLTKLTLDSLGSLGSTGSLLALPWLVLSSPLTHSWLTLDSFLAHPRLILGSHGSLGSRFVHSWLTHGSLSAHGSIG